MRREELWLQDIVDAADLIERSVAGQEFEGFLADPDARDATLYRLIVIGEALGRLPAALRDRHPEIPWQPVIGFRNRAVHAYFAIDWSIVWDTATIDVPELQRQIAAILAREYPDAGNAGGGDE